MDLSIRIFNNVFNDQIISIYFRKHIIISLSKLVLWIIKSTLNYFNPHKEDREQNTLSLSIAKSQCKRELKCHTVDISQSTESAYQCQRFDCTNLCACVILLMICPLILILKYHVLPFLFLCDSPCNGIKSDSGDTIAL